MAPHTWSHLGDTVSDTTHHMYYRGQRIKEAYYRGECIWRENRPDNVCFWDWDGTLLAAYGREEFLALSEMPSLHREWTPTMINMREYSSIPKHFENPDEILFTPDGYNWTLEEAQDFVQKFGYCDIGTIYHTPYTYLWIRIASDNSFIRLIFHQIDDNIDEHTIDWGDGSSVENYHQDIRSNYYSEHDNGVNRNHPHLYKNAGIYLVKIKGKHKFGNVSAYMMSGSLGLTISACVINSLTDIVYNFSFGNMVNQIPFYDYNINNWHDDWPARNTNMNYIGGAFNGNWRLNLLAAYINGGSVLGEYALASTAAIAIGLSNGTALEMNTGEFYCTRTPHITFPKSITSLLYNAKKTKSKITNSQANDEWNIVSSFGAGLWKPDNYSGDSTFIYAIFPPFAWGENYGDSESNHIFPTYLKTISLPPNFEEVYIPHAEFLTRIILPEGSKNFGILRDVSSSLKLVVTSIWNITDWPYSTGEDIMFHIMLKDGATANSALKVYVPPDVLFTHVGSISPIYWGAGFGVYDEYLRYSNGRINAWMAPYLKELPRTVDYKTAFEDTLPDYVKPIPVWDFENNREMT